MVMRKKLYSGRRFFQYNEDDIMFNFLLLTSFFKIFKFKSNLREAFFVSVLIINAV